MGFSSSVLRAFLGVNALVDAAIVAMALGLTPGSVPGDLVPSSLVAARASVAGSVASDAFSPSVMRAFAGMVAMWGVCRIGPVFAGGRAPLVVAALSYAGELAYFGAEVAAAGDSAVPGQMGAAGIAGVMAAACAPGRR